MISPGVIRLGAALGATLLLAACRQDQDNVNVAQTNAARAPAASTQSAPQSLQMGGAKSVTRFFVTSKGIGRGGDLGGRG